MNILKLNADQLKDIYYEGGFELGTDFVEVNVINDGRNDWQVEHKCETSELIFEFEGRYYRIYLTRWGSYWQGYELNDPEIEEVELAQKTVNYWRAL